MNLNFLFTAKVYSDLGLFFTQLPNYESAVDCLKKAKLEIEKVIKKDEALKLKALIHQNLGAVLNFKGDNESYNEATEYHETACALYGSIQG